MQLGLGEVARFFDVSERTLRRWISTRGFPVHRAHERLHCNAIEVWEWAVENHIPISRDLLERARAEPDEPAPTLATLLQRGGIHRDLQAKNKPQVLREMVAGLPLPADQDREYLATVLEAREALGSTGIGDGIALPHVRNPILLHVSEPFVSLFLLSHPIDFDAVDGRPVHALFMIVASSIPEHLRTLASLGFMLRDEQLRKLLRAGAASSEILGRLVALEAESRTKLSSRE